MEAFISVKLNQVCAKLTVLLGRIKNAALGAGPYLHHTALFPALWLRGVRASTKTVKLPFKLLIPLLIAWLLVKRSAYVRG